MAAKSSMCAVVPEGPYTMPGLQQGLVQHSVSCMQALMVQPLFLSAGSLAHVAAAGAQVH